MGGSEEKDAKVPRRGRLSSAQQSSWFAEQLEETDARPNRLLVLRFSGILERSALQGSLDAMVGRHEILRTTFGYVDGQVLQRVASPRRIPIRHVALDQHASSDAEQALTRLMQHESVTALDLSGDGPFRAHLIVLAEHQNVLLLTVHNIAWDHYSRRVFSRELATLYQQLTRCGPRLAPLPVQYLDYCARQAAAPGGEIFERAVRFWQKNLAGIPLVHGLVLDKPRPARQSFRADNFRQRLSADLRVKLVSLAAAHGLDLCTLLHAAFAVLIGRWSREDDVVIGSSKSARQMPEEESQLGCYVETLILRTDLADNPTFIQLLERTRTDFEAAREGVAVPREILVDRLKPERTQSYAPLCQIVFTREVMEERLFELGNVSMEVLPPAESFTAFDLEVSARDDAWELELDWVFAERIFEIDTIRRMAASFEVLLQSILAAAQCRVRQLALVPAEDLRLLRSWNATVANDGRDASLRARLDRVVEGRMQAIALTHGSQMMSYALLNQRSNQVARFLLGRGLKPGCVVGLCCEPSLDLIVSIVGIIKAGATYLPIDVDLPESRIGFMLREARPQWIITRRAHLGLLGRAAPAICLDDAATMAALGRVPGANITEEAADKPAQTPFCIIYTSGSAGKPKGVVGLERSLMNRIAWMQETWPCTGDEVLCQSTPIRFVDHLAEIFQALLSGCRLVIVPQALRGDASGLCRLLQAEAVTRLRTTAFFLKALLDCPGAGRLERLRQLTCGGEALSHSLVQRCRRILPNARLISLYGATESGDSLHYDVEQLERFDVMKYFGPDARSSYFGRASIGLDAAGAAPAPSMQELRRTFGKTDIPQRPTSIDHYLTSFVDTVMPGLVQVGSPTFIGHMTSALPTFMPEFSKLVSQLNQNVVKIETSRSVTFLERQVVAMLHKLFFALPQEHYDRVAQDPGHTFGIVTSGGSLSNLMAIWCARNRALVAMGASRDDLARRGAVKVQQELGYTGSVIIGSRLMHYSMRKVASLLGIGEEGIRLVPQKSNQKISITDLEATIQRARENGELIIALVGIAGATETGTIDPLDEIAAIAGKYALHFHVDAAWGGAFQFSERFRHKLRGIERADSITLCPHKQLYLPVGISLCLFRSSSSLNSIAVHADYQAAGGSYDLGQFSMEGSRPANAVLLHASLHLIAAGGYDRLIEQSMNTADYFARLVELNDYFELVGKPEINIINYRFIPAGIFRRGQQRYSETENEAIDAAVRGIQEAQFSRGKTFVSKTRILHSDHAEYPLRVFRVVISNPLTTREDLHSVLQEQLTIAASILDDGVDYESARIRSGMFAPPQQESFDHRVIPIGRPIRNTCIAVLDSDLAPVPIGAPGEICIAGDGLAQGYVCNDVETGQRFFVMAGGEYPGMRFYRTGDLGRWRAGGEVEFLGRMAARGAGRGRSGA